MNVASSCAELPWTADKPQDSQSYAHGKFDCLVIYRDLLQKKHSFRTSDAPKLLMWGNFVLNYGVSCFTLTFKKIAAIFLWYIGNVTVSFKPGIFSISYVNVLSVLTVSQLVVFNLCFIAKCKGIGQITSHPNKQVTNKSTSQNNPQIDIWADCCKMKCNWSAIELTVL